MAITMYNTSSAYPNESGFNQLAYPLIDAIIIVNPFFVVLWLVMLILTISSYYAFAQFIGRTRFFNSLLAASFSTTVIAIFFSLAGWVTPSHVMTFIGITVLSYILTTFYK